MHALDVKSLISERNEAIVTKKERVWNHTAHWLPSTNPGVHVLLSYSTQFKPLIFHNTLTPTNSSRRTLQDQRRTTALLPHNNRAYFTVSISCLAHSHRRHQGKLSYYITDYIHSPKAQAFFPSNVHKTPDSQCCLVSLESFYSSLTDYQAQRKVLASSQAILANRAFHRYVHKDRLFCLLNLSKNPQTILPKLHLLAKSDFLIFSSSLLPIHHSHSWFRSQLSLTF